MENGRTVILMAQINDTVYVEHHGEWHEMKNVVHGHWVECGAKRVCSVCEARVCAWAADCTLKYCPNCGAKMDRRDDNSDAVD